MTTAAAAADRDTAVLAAVERRVLWLATAIVHHANRVRPNPSGLKVGGHQASSASMATIMTELWFRHLRPQDRVSVKPHASPVLHAINHLLGELPARVPDHAARVRRPAELPEPREGPRPGRLLDGLGRDRGDGADLGRAGPPLRRAVRRRDAGGRAGSTPWSATRSWTRAPAGRPILDPMVGELGEVVWVVDLNRQSLDRVVPILGATRLQGMFAAAGWQVLTVKYGHLLEELFARPGGDGPARAHRRDVQPRVPAPAALHRRAAAASACPAVTGPGPARARRLPRRRHAARRRSATSAATTSTPSARPSPRSTTPGPR